MAKKIKVGLKTAGAEPAAGDVNISYKGSRIAGLSESSTAVLETENTIVQNDIEVEYTKPGGTPSLPTLTVTKNDAVVEYNGQGGCPFVKIEDGNIVNSVLNNATNYIPNPTVTGFEFVAIVGSLRDNYIVVGNGNTATYDSMQKAYLLYFDLDDYNTPVTLSITNKP